MFYIHYVSILLYIISLEKLLIITDGRNWISTYNRQFFMLEKNVNSIKGNGNSSYGRLDK
jgi:hypothetical protein